MRAASTVMPGPRCRHFPGNTRAHQPEITSNILDIAEVIGRHHDLPVVAIAPEDAGGHFGFLDGFFAPDIPASSALTRELIGRQPTHSGLIEDLEKGHYFVNA